MERQLENILVENARVLFKNFTGLEGKYNRAGDRNFCLVLDPDTAEKLIRDGWNVKFLRAKTADDEDLPYLQVSVGFGKRPPMLYLISSKGRNKITEDEAEILDWIETTNIDLIVRPYEWSVSGKSGVKAYLKSYYATLEEDYLVQKYRDVPEIGTGVGPQALTAAVVDSNVIDADWYESPQRELEGR